MCVGYRSAKEREMREGGCNRFSREEDEGRSLNRGWGMSVRSVEEEE